MSQTYFTTIGDAALALPTLYGLIQTNLDTLRSSFSGTSFPSGPVPGQIAWRTDSETLHVWDGSGWLEFGDLIDGVFILSEDNTATGLNTFTQGLRFGGNLQSTGGNARGANATDLQVSRSADTQVASGVNSSLLGGTNNTASGDGSVVCGGVVNTASGTDAAILGGNGNENAGFRAAIVGGEGNFCDGQWGVVLAGRNCENNSNYGIVGGNRAKASGDGVLVLCDSQDADFASTAPNQANLRYSGGYRFMGGGPYFEGTLTTEGAAEFGASIEVGGNVIATGRVEVGESLSGQPQIRVYDAARDAFATITLDDGVFVFTDNAPEGAGIDAGAGTFSGELRVGSNALGNDPQILPYDAAEGDFGSILLSDNVYEFRTAADTPATIDAGAGTFAGTVDSNETQWLDFMPADGYLVGANWVTADAAGPVTENSTFQTLWVPLNLPPGTVIDAIRVTGFGAGGGGGTPPQGEVTAQIFSRAWDAAGHTTALGAEALATVVGFTSVASDTETFGSPVTIAEGTRYVVRVRARQSVAPGAGTARYGPAGVGVRTTRRRL